MPFIAREIFLVNEEVVVSVQLPKPAVKYIKVLVGEIFPDFVDVFFLGNLLEDLTQVRLLEISERNLSIII